MALTIPFGFGLKPSLTGLALWAWNWTGAQGPIAEVQLDQGNVGGCLLTSFGVAAVSALVIACAFALLIANQQGVLP